MPSSHVFPSASRWVILLRNAMWPWKERDFSYGSEMSSEGRLCEQCFKSHECDNVAGASWWPPKEPDYLEGASTLWKCKFCSFVESHQWCDLWTHSGWCKAASGNPIGLVVSHISSYPASFKVGLCHHVTHDTLLQQSPLACLDHLESQSVWSPTDNF